MQISVNGQYQDNARSNIGWVPRSFSGPEEFRELVKGDHCPAVFLTGYRSNDNFQSCDFIFGDVDGGITLEDFRQVFRGVEYYIATSKNHQKAKKDDPACDRFHVFFPVEKRIESREEMSRKLKSLHRCYDFFDKAAKDPARFLHGYKDTEVYFQSGDPLELPEYEEPRKTQAPVIPLAGELVGDQKTEVLNALSLAAASGVFTDYSDWLRLGMALKREGFSLEDWAALSNPEEDRGEMGRKWNGFNPSEVSMGTLYEYARRAVPDLHKPGSQHRELVKLRIGAIAPQNTVPADLDIPADLRDFNDLKTPPDEALYKAVSEKLTLWRDRRGKLQEDTGTYLALMEADPAFWAALRYDEATGEILSAYRDIDDLYTAILRRCNFYGLDPSMQRRRDIVSLLSQDPRYRFNSVESLIRRLRGVQGGRGLDDLRELLGHIRLEDEDSRLYVLEFLDLFFKRTAVHLLAAFTPRKFPADWCPVFVGRQGVGKSRLCRFFAMDEDLFVDLGDKLDAPFGSANFARVITGKIIGELGEMSVMSRGDIEVIKAGISAVEDAFTPKYKEGVRRVPRYITFMGTSNNAAFLKDMTGNRRFWPIAVAGVDAELFRKPDLMERIWSYYLGVGEEILRGGNLEILHPPLGLEEYFAGVRSSSVDVGLHGEVYQDAILTLERELVNSGYDYIKLTARMVIDRVYDGEAYKAPTSSNKLVGHLLTSLGYTGGVFKFEGRNARGYRLSVQDVGLKARVGVGAENPF